jgi:TRAP-type C4-dicarboxylate transport system permease large subunit
MAVLRASLFDAVKVTSFALFIVAMASVIAHVFNLAGIISGTKELVLGLGLGKYGTLVLFFVGYLIGGMFLEAWSMLFITMPLVMPILHELNISPVWWGVAYVIAGENSIMTPPFGLSLFVLQGIAPQYPVETIFRAALPLFIPVYLTLALMVIFPEIALWLPSLLGL